MCEWDGVVLNDDDDFFFRKSVLELCVCVCIWTFEAVCIFIKSYFFFTQRFRGCFLSVILQYLRQNIIYASLSLLCVGEEEDFGVRGLRWRFESWLWTLIWMSTDDPRVEVLCFKYVQTIP